MLRVKGIEVFYGDLQALRGVSLEVNQGEIVSIIGSNGAGKSTTLMTISGILKPKRGDIQFDQDFIHQYSSSKIVSLGIVQIPEGRQLFPTLTVIENLEMGSQFPKAKKVREETMAGLQTFSQIGGEEKSVGRDPQWRGAADARHWKGINVQTHSLNAR